MKMIRSLIFLIAITSFTLILIPCRAYGKDATYTIIAKNNEQINQVDGDLNNHIKNNDLAITDSSPNIGYYNVKIKNPSILKNLKNVFFVSKIHNTKLSTSPQLKEDVDVPDLTNYQWDMKQITNNDDAYKYIPKNIKENSVAVIDSGIDFNNPSLITSKDNINRNFVPKGGIDGKNNAENGDSAYFDDQFGHGTEVSGQIAANGSIKGTAPGAKLRSYRVFDDNGKGKTAWILNAISSAIKDKNKIINLSLGEYVDGSSLSKPDRIGYQRIIKQALKHKIIVVASMGNDNVDDNNQMQLKQLFKKINPSQDVQGKVQDYPADINGVVKVASSARDGQLSSFSNYYKDNNNYDYLISPGGDERLLNKVGPVAFYDKKLFMNEFILTTTNDNNYSYFDGTSLSAPKVSGTLLDTMCKFNLYKNPKKVIKIVHDTSDCTPSGIRVINISNALNYRRNIVIKIKKGDTLSEYSQKYNCPINEIANINSIKDINLIYADDLITIPYSY